MVAAMAAEITTRFGSEAGTPGTSHFRPDLFCVIRCEGPPRLAAKERKLLIPSSTSIESGCCRRSGCQRRCILPFCVTHVRGCCPRVLLKVPRDCGLWAWSPRSLRMRVLALRRDLVPQFAKDEGFSLVLLVGWQTRGVQCRQPAWWGSRRAEGRAGR